MLSIQRPKWLRGGALCLLLICAVNHGVAWWRQYSASMRAPRDLKLNVQMEATADHNTIGIDEAVLPTVGTTWFLHFSTLGLWDYQRDAPVKCPASLQALSGKRFSSVGFMYPLQEGNYVKTFCLLRSTQTCCYGPRPQFNQYILVETRSPVAFERLTPVLVTGTFFVDPKPDEGYLYRMQADAVQVVDDETPQVDAVSAAQQAHLPLFDFGLLTGLNADLKHASQLRKLQALEGKKIVAAGYCVRRTRATLPRLTLSNAWWDGIAQGEPPTAYNSLQVFPADEQQAPPLWKEYQVFTGVVRLSMDSQHRAQVSAVQLKDARLGVPGVTSVRAIGSDLPIPWQAECLLIGGVLCSSLGWRRSAPGESSWKRICFSKLRAVRILLVAVLVSLTWGMIHYTAQSDRDAELVAAVMNTNTKKVLALLDQGADPNGMTAEPAGVEPGRPPIPLLQDAARYAEKSAVIVKALLDRGAHIDMKDSGGKTALMIAASLSTTDAVKVLIDGGADLEARDGSGWTALRYAVWKKQMATVRMLLDAGADVNTRDSNGKSPLMAAVDTPEIASLLLNRGARADVEDHNGWTALRYATNNEDVETARLLRQKSSKDKSE